MRRGKTLRSARDVLKYLTWRKANALCCVAIHHKGKYWGHIGAEYTDGATFGAPGLRLMHSAARMIELLIERSDSTRQLARSEYEKKMIFNILNIPLVLFDAERKIIRVNPAAEKLVGMTEAEIIQRPCPETFCNHSMSRGKCPVERTLKTGLPQTQEAVLNGRNYQLSTLPFFENGKGECPAKLCRYDGCLSPAGEAEAGDVRCTGCRSGEEFLPCHDES